MKHQSQSYVMRNDHNYFAVRPPFSRDQTHQIPPQWYQSPTPPPLGFPPTPAESNSGSLLKKDQWAAVPPQTWPGYIYIYIPTGLFSKGSFSINRRGLGMLGEYFSETNIHASGLLRCRKHPRWRRLCPSPSLKGLCTWECWPESSNPRWPKAASFHKSIHVNHSNRYVYKYMHTYMYVCMYMYIKGRKHHLEPTEKDMFYKQPQRWN